MIKITVGTLSESFGNNKIKIYRALPATTTEIRKNDYVTKSRKFAADHAVTSAMYNEEPFQVIWAYVDATELKEAPNPGEFFYIGSGIRGNPSQIATEDGNIKWLRV